MLVKVEGDEQMVHKCAGSAQRAMFCIGTALMHNTKGFLILLIMVVIKKELYK